MKNTIKNIALTAALALTSATAGAQSLTGYFMDNIPNINIYNPAFNPHCKVYVSIYDIYGGFGNSGFAINDMFKHITNGDKYIIDLDKIYDKLHKNNYQFADVNVQLFNFGFRIGEGYAHAGVSIRGYENFA